MIFDFIQANLELLTGIAFWMLILAIAMRRRQAQMKVRAKAEADAWLLDYIEVHGGSLSQLYTRMQWSDGTVTDSSWRYSAGSNCVQAKTARLAVELHRSALLQGSSERVVKV